MNRRESYSDRMDCLLQGNGAVAQALEAARTFGTAQLLTNDDCARLCIVIEELVANLFDHGGLTSEDEVELSLSKEPGGIRVVITDSAKPFDPRSASPPIRPPQRGGGAGIDLVRAWAQIVDYKVTEDSNRLELLLPLAGQ